VESAEGAVVITADRGLVGRVEALGASARGPRVLLELLESARE
jgi:8-oxo-dGTP diphosphatase